MQKKGGPQRVKKRNALKGGLGGIFGVGPWVFEGKSPVKEGKQRKGIMGAGKNLAQGGKG